jgi:nucleotide sugar dehydrogenase
MKTVSVIGACGHVGFPFSVILANSGYKVYGIDLNLPLCDRMNVGFIPYIEHGVDKPYTNAINNKTLEFTVDYSKIQESDVVAIMIGTPVDSEGNPRLDDILDFVELELFEWIEPGTLIILRSTVAPGTTELIRDLFGTKGFIEGKDYYLTFCPERVAQAYGIEETKNLPQLIGAFSETSYKIAENFFQSIP